MIDSFFELIRVAIGHQVCLSRTPSADGWGELYAMAKKQAVVGVCFCGVQRLPKEQLVEMPVQLKMQWFALAESVKQKNEVMNRKCAEVYNALTKEGFRCVILKGQGVATLYCDGDSTETRFRGFQRVSEGCRGFQKVSEGLSVSRNIGLYRQSGDIDVWMWKNGFALKENRKEVVRFARTIQPDATGSEHHTAVEWMGTEVEMHYEPAYFCNPFANRHFRKWFMEYDKSRFMISDKGFCIPDAEFNRVFLLAHSFRHYMSEGLGLRQVMDYYFLLQDIKVNPDHDNLIKRLGMERFEKAMKWVIGCVFEGKDGEDGRKYGKMLLRHIMEGGNFGMYKAKTVACRHTHIGRFINQLAHDIRLMMYYPSEAVWAPLSMIREFLRIRI